MANNYCQGSAMLKIPSEKRNQASSIVERVKEELEKEHDWVGFTAEMESDGLWIYEEEFLEVDHVETLVSALQDELELDEPFIMSWAYTCSKMRLDQFGGGAILIQRGHETKWVDAYTEMMRASRDRGNKD